jgi:putative hydrolase
MLEKHLTGFQDILTKYNTYIISSKHIIEIIAGFEAKILIDGSIDCPEKYADKYFLIASFHTRYHNKQVWLQAFLRRQLRIQM